MRVSTKGRYALRLMVELAKAQPNDYVTIKTIAENQEVSHKYLEQIVAMLSKADFIQSLRGPQGGYRLKTSPDNYIVGDILRLTEGNLSPVPCLQENIEDCQKADTCHTIKLWRKMDNAIKEVVDTTSLADLLCDDCDMNLLFSI